MACSKRIMQLTGLLHIFALFSGLAFGFAFSSGMAAICTSLLNFLGQGDRIVTTRNLYGGTVLSLDQDFTRFGIDVH